MKKNFLINTILLKLFIVKNLIPKKSKLKPEVVLRQSVDPRRIISEYLIRRDISRIRNSHYFFNHYFSTQLLCNNGWELLKIFLCLQARYYVFEDFFVKIMHELQFQVARLQFLLTMTPWRCLPFVIVDDIFCASASLISASYKVEQ